MWKRLFSLLRFLAALQLGLLAVLVLVGLWWRREGARRAIPCPSWLGWALDHPLWERISGAHTILERIGIQPGERVLDVGAGTGRLAIPAALLVSVNGQVAAVDIQPAMLNRLTERAEQAGITNLKVYHMDISGEVSLEPESFDRAWLVTVLGEIPDKQAALRNIYRSLKPGGILSISEALPDPHYQTHNAILALGRSAGFEPVRYWGNFISYTQNFIKPT